MRHHIQGEDYELWDIVTDGPLSTLKENAEGLDMPKIRADCNADDLKKREKNGEKAISSEIEQVAFGPKVVSEIISEVAENLENIFVMIVTIAGVEITKSRNIGSKDKKKKEKESEGTQGDVREKGKEGVVESSPTPAEMTEETGAMVLWSEDAAEEEERWREKEGSGAGDASAAEGLVKLRKRFEEPVPSVANKKIKVTSSIPIETPPTRGRATRSQNKHSKVAPERALEESKRKVVAKGKKKVSEHVQADEIEEMDLVLHDEDKAEEVETVDAEPSTLAKRTRYARKSRKVQIVEEEESEEEEESDEELDKMVKFGKRTILKDRLRRDLEEEGMVMLVEKL
uniref:ABC transporter F family member 4-like n=1 Tax=Nicotiana tabacum TaxID=4097 RepID=A0A1S3Y067_TOBAC|nr:PREDICTED: ABC transporter F family member 4-like [Nicotiana tabacum]